MNGLFTVTGTPTELRKDDVVSFAQLTGELVRADVVIVKISRGGEAIFFFSGKESEKPADQFLFHGLVENCQDWAKWTMLITKTRWELLSAKKELVQWVVK